MRDTIRGRPLCLAPSSIFASGPARSPFWLGLTRHRKKNTRDPKYITTDQNRVRPGVNDIGGMVYWSHLVEIQNTKVRFKVTLILRRGTHFWDALKGCRRTGWRDTNFKIVDLGLNGRHQPIQHIRCWEEARRRWWGCPGLLSFLGDRKRGGPPRSALFQRFSARRSSMPAGSPENALPTKLSFLITILFIIELPC